MYILYLIFQENNNYFKIPTNNYSFFIYLILNLILSVKVLCHYLNVRFYLF
jgi:hypothetical protein